MKFTFATFCFGDRYYEQVNRFITDISLQNYKPNLVVITDNVDKIIKESFVNAVNVADYDGEYLKYENNYYDFDFSVKRFAVRASVDLGYEKVILVDADMRDRKSVVRERV